MHPTCSAIMEDSCSKPEWSIIIDSLLTLVLSNGAGTAYTSEAAEFTFDFKWESCCSMFSLLCNVFLDQKTKDQATRNPLQTGDKLRCSGRVGSSCSTSDTRCVMLIKNPMISHEWGKDKERYYLEPFKNEACEQHLTWHTFLWL